MGYVIYVYLCSVARSSHVRLQADPHFQSHPIRGTQQQRKGQAEGQPSARDTAMDHLPKILRGQTPVGPVAAAFRVQHGLSSANYFRYLKIS